MECYTEIPPPPGISAATAAAASSGEMVTLPSILSMAGTDGGAGSDPLPFILAESSPRRRHMFPSLSRSPPAAPIHHWKGNFLVFLQPPSLLRWFRLNVSSRIAAFQPAQIADGRRRFSGSGMKEETEQEESGLIDQV